MISNKRWWAFGITGLIIVGGAVWGRIAHGQTNASPDTTRAFTYRLPDTEPVSKAVNTQEIRLVDDNRRVYGWVRPGSLSLQSENGDTTLLGSKGLTFMHPDPNRPNHFLTRMELAEVFSDNPALTFYDENGRSRAAFEVEHGNPQLTMFDRQAHGRVFMEMDNDNDVAHLSMYDANKDERLVLMQVQQTAEIVLSRNVDQGNSHRVVQAAAMFVEKDGTAKVRLGGPPNKASITLSLSRNGIPRLVLTDGSGKSQTLTMSKGKLAPTKP